MIVSALAAGGIAVGLTLDEPRLKEMPRRVTPSTDIELGLADPSKAAAATPMTATADFASGSCLDHPSDVPSTRLGFSGCAALKHNADGTCTLETATIENWRPVSVRRVTVRCPSGSSR